MQIDKYNKQGISWNISKLAIDTMSQERPKLPAPHQIVEELWETTLNPDNRTMLRVQYSKGTKEKSKEDQKLIKVLMGDEVAPRKDFITNNALDVANLDI